MTCGLKAWKAAAQKGYWVNGTSDSFGESIDFDIDSLSGKISKRVKLTHMENKSTEMDIVPTYKLIFSDKKLGIEERTHFYWMSSFAFDCVTQKYPEIKNKIHGCGPGKTYDHILKNISNPQLAFYSTLIEPYFMLSSSFFLASFGVIFSPFYFFLINVS